MISKCQNCDFKTPSKSYLRGDCSNVLDNQDLKIPHVSQSGSLLLLHTVIKSNQGLSVPNSKE